MTLVFNRPVRTYSLIIDNSNQPVHDHRADLVREKARKQFGKWRGRPIDAAGQAQYDAVVALNKKHGIKPALNAHERQLRSMFVAASHRTRKKPVTLPKLTCLEAEP